MLRNQKTGNSLKMGELQKQKLRMFRSNQAFQASLIGIDETEPENLRSYSLKDIQTATLETEQRKAKALHLLQNTRRFY